MQPIIPPPEDFSSARFEGEGVRGNITDYYYVFLSSSHFECEGGGVRLSCHELVGGDKSFTIRMWRVCQDFVDRASFSVREAHLFCCLRLRKSNTFVLIYSDSDSTCYQ